MDVLQFIIGSILLSFGKKVIWLMVAALSFLLGNTFLTIFFPMKDSIFIMVLAAIIALIFTIITIFLQKTAVVLGGFVGGGLITSKAVQLLTIPQFHQLPTWITFLIGGTIGILIAFLLFNWAILLLSAFTGSLLIVQIFPLTPLNRFLLIIPLSILGAYLQTRLNRPKLSTTPL